MTVKECHFGTEKPIAPAKTYRNCLTRGQKSIQHLNVTAVKMSKA